MTADQTFQLTKLALEIVAGLIYAALLYASSPGGKKVVDARLTAIGTTIEAHLPLWAATLVAAKIAQLEATLDSATGEQKMAALVAFAASRGITVPQSTLQAVYDDIKVAGILCGATPADPAPALAAQAAQ